MCPQDTANGCQPNMPQASIKESSNFPPGSAFLSWSHVWIAPHTLNPTACAGTFAALALPPLVILLSCSHECVCMCSCGSSSRICSGNKAHLFHSIPMTSSQQIPIRASWLQLHLPPCPLNHSGFQHSETRHNRTTNSTTMAKVQCVPTSFTVFRQDFEC